MTSLNINHSSTDINDIFLQEGDITEDDIEGKDAEDIFEVVWAKIEAAYQSQKDI